MLKDAGIGAAAYYRVPAHLQPAMRDYPPTVDLPGTEEAARTNLALPMSPVLDRAQADEVVAALAPAASAGALARSRLASRVDLVRAPADLQRARDAGAGRRPCSGTERQSDRSSRHVAAVDDDGAGGRSNGLGLADHDARRRERPSPSADAARAAADAARPRRPRAARSALSCRLIVSSLVVVTPGPTNTSSSIVM